jgi:hypothetical protein
VIALPLPVGLALDATSWEQARLIMLQLIVQRLAIIQQQTSAIPELPQLQSPTLI